MTIKMKSNRFWLMLLGGLLLISAVVGWMFAGKDGKTAVVTLDGIVLAEVDLSKVEAPYTIEAEGKHHNTIEFDRGRLRVSYADCPDQVCVRQGWVDTDMTPIVCLPNGLVIQITGGDRELDGQTG